MREWKAIFGLVLLLVGGFVLYKIVPVYWGDYKLGRMLEEQAIYYTYNAKSDQDLRNLVVTKANDMDVPLSPQQVDILRGGGDLTITASYSVHVDLPFYPLDLNFNTSSKNKNVMR